MCAGGISVGVKWTAGSRPIEGPTKRIFKLLAKSLIRYPASIILPRGRLPRIDFNDIQRLSRIHVHDHADILIKCANRNES